MQQQAQNVKELEQLQANSRTQLLLQESVEGLSVVAISYYAVSLAGYLLYPVAEALDLSKGMLTAAVTLPVVACVWFAVSRIREKVERGAPEP